MWLISIVARNAGKATITSRSAKPIFTVSLPPKITAYATSKPPNTSSAIPALSKKAICGCGLQEDTHVASHIAVDPISATPATSRTAASDFSSALSIRNASTSAASATPPRSASGSTSNARSIGPRPALTSNRSTPRANHRPNPCANQLLRRRPITSPARPVATINGSRRPSNAKSHSGLEPALRVNCPSQVAGKSASAARPLGLKNMAVAPNSSSATKTTSAALRLWAVAG